MPHGLPHENYDVVLCHPSGACAAHAIACTKMLNLGHRAFFFSFSLEKSTCRIEWKESQELINSDFVQLGKWLPVLSRVVMRTVLGIGPDERGQDRDQWNVVQNNGVYFSLDPSFSSSFSNCSISIFDSIAIFLSTCFSFHRPESLPTPRPCYHKRNTGHPH